MCLSSLLLELHASLLSNLDQPRYRHFLAQSIHQQNTGFERQSRRVDILVTPSIHTLLAASLVGNHVPFRLQIIHN